jgi:hypothetical protein
MMHLTKMGIAVALCGVLVLGCSTTQGIGAASGAAVGAITGVLIEGDAEGAIAGAMIGAAVGWGAAALYEYHTTRDRTAQQDAELYGYTQGVGPVVKIRGAAAEPREVRPGDTVQLTTDYSVNAPSGSNSVFVTESWELEKDGDLISEFQGKREARESGGWVAEGSIPVPDDATPGTYVVGHRVATDSGSEDRRDAVFIVQN